MGRVSKKPKTNASAKNNAAPAKKTTEPADWRAINLLLKDKLHYLYLTGLFSDINVVVKNQNKKETIKCHSLILKTASPVFESMLSGNFKEKDSIEIEDADANTMKVFIKYLYTEIVDFVSVVQAWNVYKVASKYFITSLENKCLDYISQNSNYRTACINYNNADYFGLETIKETNYKKLLDNIPDAIKEGLINELSEKGISSILEEKNVRVRECELFASISNWIEAQIAGKENKDALKTHLVDLFIPKIRFMEMSPEEFVRCVVPSTLLSDDIKYKILLKLNLPTSPSVPPYTQTFPEKRYQALLNCQCRKTTMCCIAPALSVKSIEFAKPEAYVELDRGISSQNANNVISFSFKIKSLISGEMKLLNLESNNYGYYLKCSANSTSFDIVHNSYNGLVKVVFPMCVTDGNAHSLVLNFSNYRNPTCTLDNIQKSTGNYYNYHVFERILFGCGNNPPNVKWCIHDLKVGSHVIEFQRDHNELAQVGPCSCP